MTEAPHPLADDPEFEDARSLLTIHYNVAQVGEALECWSGPIENLLRSMEVGSLKHEAIDFADALNVVRDILAYSDIERHRQLSAVLGERAEGLMAAVRERAR